MIRKPELYNLDVNYGGTIEDVDHHINLINEEFPTGCLFDMHSVIYNIAKKLKPENYLEVGTFCGRSMAIVLKASPETSGYGIDVWEPYAELPTNSPELVLGVMKAVGIEKLPTFLAGLSCEMLPALWAEEKIPQKFELILVDGDHSEEGAKKDLSMCIPRLADGGILVFHDISHPQLGYLADVVLEFKRNLPDFLFIESYNRAGFCAMIKYPVPGWVLGI